MPTVFILCTKIFIETDKFFRRIEEFTGNFFSSLKNFPLFLLSFR